MFILAIALGLLNFTFAESIDQRLESYVKEFKLRPIDHQLSQNTQLIELGRKLFFDKNLSGNKNINCAECHHPRVMTHDGLPLALGEGARGIEAHGGRMQAQGKLLARNSPALLNLNYNQPFMFWDGRVEKIAPGVFQTPVPLDPKISSILRSSVAAQAMFPMVDHAEMRGQKGTNPIADAATEEEAWELLTKRILENKEYKDSFSSLYPDQEINIAHIAEAIAEFEIQNFSFTNTPYDRYLKGDSKALNEIQKMGMDIFFGKGKCGSCHQGDQLALNEFHNIGTPQIGPGKTDGDDFGRYGVTNNIKDLYAFRTPGLRNVSLTAPYMHNGAFKTLAQVIEHYDDIEASLIDYNLVNNWKNYVEEIKNHDHSTDQMRMNHLSTKLTTKLYFTEEEEKALVEFLRTALTDQVFLDQEISEEYKTYARFQLKESGFNKLHQATSRESTINEMTYYYFDIFQNGGFALRELEQPMRLMIVESGADSELVFRQQLHKSASADQGIIIDTSFNKTEKIKLDAAIALRINTNFNDMFNRIYQYIRPGSHQDIPLFELDLIKVDVSEINTNVQQIPLKSKKEISNLLNVKIDDLFFVPTSLNSKDTYVRNIQFNQLSIEVILQKSILRTEDGNFESTWAIEFETSKVLKKDLATLNKFIFDYLVNAGLVANDFGGHSPSPSKTTEKILQKIFP
jgi:cytochrome c peroxidase